MHVSGRIDPVSDIEVVNTELALADLQTVDKQLSRYSKVARTGAAGEEKRRPCGWLPRWRRSSRR